MGRKKVSMEYIQKDKTRSMTYEKRKKSLVKKAYELGKLCDVPLCMVIYPAGPNSVPVTYPEKTEEFAAVIKRYLSGSKEENAKRALNLEQVLALPNKKKKMNSNSDLPLPLPQAQPQQAYSNWHPSLDGLNRDELLNSAFVIDCKLRQVEERMMTMTRPPPSLPTAPVNGDDDAMKMMMQWLMCNASSSSYYPNSYLPDNNVLPSHHPLLQSSSGVKSWYQL